MLNKIVVGFVIPFTCLCISVSYAQDQSSKWEISKGLGDIAIRMSPRTALLVSDKGASMGAPSTSSAQKTDLAEFELLLKKGADPSAIRIAGFEAAGRRTLGSGLTFMSTGNPGRVVPAEEGGLTLFNYLIYNNLHAACSLLDGYGYVKPNDVDKLMSADMPATPLLFSSEKGYVEIVKLLLAKGAQVNKATDTGITPLILASINGHIEIVKLLLANGAQVDKEMNNGMTPLMYAGKSNHIEIVRLLLAKGAQVNKITDTGITPLLIASNFGNVEIVKVLLAKGAEVDKGKVGLTPLFYACKNNHVEIVKVLLAKGSRVDNFSGKVLLRDAKNNGYSEIVELLIKHGANSQ